MKKLFWTFLFLVILSVCTSTSYAEVKVTQNIKYGSDEAQIIDVYQPDGFQQGNKYPVVIWIHGGGWRNGSMHDSIYRDIMTTWAKQGIVVVGIDYRLSPKYMHPIHVQDVATGISWVYRNIDSFGGDINRISLMGHSAGAHLVALVATNPNYLGAYGLSPGKILANVFAIDSAAYDLSDPVQAGRKLIRNAFGTDPSVLKDASPTLNVQMGGSYPPFIMAVNKIRDDAVAQSRNLQKKLRNDGVSAEVIIVDYPNLAPLAAHMQIYTDLAKLDRDLTKTLLCRVLEKS